jgi:hypothetical protein
MKTTLAITAAIAACASAQLFAANVKEGTISFALTGQRQVSVSTSASALNQGAWTNSPTHYKTGTLKITQADIINYISETKFGTTSAYGSSPKLVLVQGELSGFFTETPALWATKPGSDYTGYIETNADKDYTTVIGSSTNSLYAALPNGRSFETNPVYGENPIGHLQPWGQIYVKFATKTNTIYDNVTYFFGLTVQECYDCLYLNSFVSDASFTFTKKTTAGSQSGPPCCSVPPVTKTTMTGSGKDHYYLTLSFDDTVNNPYLDSGSILYSGWDGISPSVGNADGIQPDVISYYDAITSNAGSSSQYEGRFTLNGILTYNWNLKFVNSNDLYPDFVGTASYAANGFGFISLYCTLLTGSATITESIIKDPSVSTSYSTPYQVSWYENNYDSDYYSDYDLAWYSVGNYSDAYNTGSLDSLNQNIYFNWYGFTPETPLNTGANLTYHASYEETYEPFVTENSANYSQVSAAVK